MQTKTRPARYPSENPAEVPASHKNERLFLFMGLFFGLFPILEGGLYFYQWYKGVNNQNQIKDLVNERRVILFFIHMGLLILDNLVDLAHLSQRHHHLSFYKAAKLAIKFQTYLLLATAFAYLIRLFSRSQVDQNQTRVEPFENYTLLVFTVAPTVQEKLRNSLSNCTLVRWFCFFSLRMLSSGGITTCLLLSITTVIGDRFPAKYRPQSIIEGVQK